jgi:FkbM family methyltransferase
LEPTLAKSHLASIRLVRAAVSDRAGVAPFMAVGVNIGGSRLAIAGISGTQDEMRGLMRSLTIVSLGGNDRGNPVALAQGAAIPLTPTSVTTRTIDSIIEEAGRVPKLVKMDIEGAELLALRGATKLISGGFGPPPWFVIEYSTLSPTMGGRREDLFELLVAHGYRALRLAKGKTSGGGLVPVPTTLDAPEHDNLIFAPPEPTAV